MALDTTAKQSSEVKERGKHEAYARFKDQTHCLEIENSRPSEALEQARSLHFYCWSLQPKFIAVAQAKSVAEARHLVLTQIGETLDGSCPERAKAYEYVVKNTPAIWHFAQAEFALTDSAELEEQEAYSEQLNKRIQELESALASSNLQLEIIRRCVRCGAEYRADGRCSRFQAGCQGGVGEAHANDTLRDRLAAKEEELKALRETPCTYDHNRPLVAMTAERDWENARADRFEQREKWLREALAIAHDVLNPRRFELITKRNMSALTEAEEQELRKLTEFVDCYVDLIAPLPPTPIVEAALAEVDSK